MFPITSPAESLSKLPATLEAFEPSAAEALTVKESQKSLLDDDIPKELQTLIDLVSANVKMEEQAVASACLRSI